MFNNLNEKLSTVHLSCYQHHLSGPRTSSYTPHGKVIYLLLNDMKTGEDKLIATNFIS